MDPLVYQNLFPRVVEKAQPLPITSHFHAYGQLPHLTIGGRYSYVEETSGPSLLVAGHTGAILLTSFGGIYTLGSYSLPASPFVDNPLFRELMLACILADKPVRLFIDAIDYTLDPSKHNYSYGPLLNTLTSYPNAIRAVWEELFPTKTPAPV